MLKKYDLALIDYEKSISLDKNYKSPYLGKASLFVVTSKEDEAIEILDGIIKKYLDKDLPIDFFPLKKMKSLGYRLTLLDTKLPTIS